MTSLETLSCNWIFCLSWIIHWNSISAVSPLNEEFWKKLISPNWLSPEWSIRITKNGLKTCLRVEFSTFSQFSTRFRQFARFLKFWPFWPLWPPKGVKVNFRKLITSWFWVEIRNIRLLMSFLVKLKKWA